jgi:hypothetical protein
MACPYFEPQRKLEAGAWTHVPRLPLGSAYSGVCRARAGEALEPAEEHQRELCNLGYARGRCDDFPVAARADAVRFSLKGTTVLYILEKDHAPLSHGVVELRKEDGTSNRGNKLLWSQARAFAGLVELDS